MFSLKRTLLLTAPNNNKIKFLVEDLACLTNGQFENLSLYLSGCSTLSLTSVLILYYIKPAQIQIRVILSSADLDLA